MRSDTIFSSGRWLTGAVLVMVLVCGSGPGRAEPGPPPLPAIGTDTTVLAEFETLSGDDLQDRKGGMEVVDLRGMAAQTNVATSQGRNDNNLLVNAGPGATMANGAIYATSVASNRGIAAVMQNTGNFVNMNYNMNVNIHLH